MTLLQIKQGVFEFLSTFPFWHHLLECFCACLWGLYSSILSLTNILLINDGHLKLPSAEGFYRRSQPVRGHSQQNPSASLRQGHLSRSNVLMNPQYSSDCSLLFNNLLFGKCDIVIFHLSHCRIFLLSPSYCCYQEGESKSKCPFCLE